MGQLPDFKGVLIALALVCIGVGLGMSFALPWLWALLKPLLHSLTA